MSNRLAKAWSLAEYLTIQPLRRGRGVSLAKALVHVALTYRLNDESPIEPISLSDLRLGQQPIALPPPSLWCPPPRGGQDAGGLAAVAAIARALDCAEVFEIGTYTGLSALTVAMNLPGSSVVHTLDLPNGASPTLPVGISDASLIADTVARVYVGFPEASRIQQHLGDSATFDFSRFSGRCGLVYVDGAHSWAYVNSDTGAAFQMADRKAAIIWDDYWPAAPDVVRYLDELSRSERLWRVAGTRLVLWLSVEAAEAICPR